ncbi:MAG: flagellar motor switch protein FliN [Pseudomonadota bacterium]
MSEDEKLNLDELDQTAAETMVEEEAGNDLTQVSDAPQTRAATDLQAVFDVPVNVSAVLGKSRMDVSALLKMTRGTVIELDRKVGEAIDIYVNNRLVARGEVVVVEERLGITMTEIIKGGQGG